MSRCISVLSESSNALTAVDEVCSKIDEEIDTPIAIIFYANADIFVDCAHLIHEKFPGIDTIGSATYINIINNAHARVGLSAMAFFSGVEFSCGVLEEVDRYPMKYVKSVTYALSKLKSTENTCCLEFTCAFKNGEELVMDTLSRGLEGTGIEIFGGSSGCEFDYKDSRVALNGRVYDNSTVFALIHNLNGKIFIYKENIYKPTSTVLTATNVNCEERRVYTFDDRPAADVMKEILKCSDEELSERLLVSPVGRFSKDNIFITDAKQVNDDGSITYLATIYNTSKLAVLEQDDIKSVWKETKEKCHKAIKKPSFTIAVNCGGRSYTFENMGIMDDFVHILSKGYGTFATLSGFGEQLNGTHFNQSLVLAAFE